MASADRASETEEYLPSLYRPSTVLPISQHKRALQYTVSTYPITIVVGETGSGKTTQLPQFLDEAGWTRDGKVIAITQPRRVAAATVATRVAEEMGVKLGEEVGYSIRFEDMTSPRTRIKYMTDGMLLREALIDPLLSRYSVVMVDEAHERSVSTDLLLGVLKKVRRKRKELRLVVSSATLQAEEFLRYFTGSEEDAREMREMRKGKAVAKEGEGKEGKGEDGGELATIVSIAGRCYPVDVLYLEEPTENYVEKAVQTVFDIHLKEGDGDILVFLTGREEIEKGVSEIQERSSNLHPRAPRLLALPLYAGLPHDQQLAVFDPTPENTRKVILATNIAEASLTIDGIVFVVDSGFVKLRAYNPATGIESLTAVPISKAAATQRAGRAGRTRPGKCFRLYRESAYDGVLPDVSVPEIQRCNMAPVILQLKALGVDNVARFDYLTSPPAELVVRGLELLFALGALDEYAKLTKPLGFRMAEMPLDPMLSKTLLNSVTLNCVSQILSIAAMTSVQTVFVEHSNTASSKRTFTAAEGDHLTLLNVYTSFTSPTLGKKSAQWCRAHNLNHRALVRAVSVRSQLFRHLQRAVPNLAELVEKEEKEAKGEGEKAGRAGKAGNEEKAGMRATAETIRRCVASGYFAHAARMLSDGTFRAVGAGEDGETLWAHPSSVMFNRKADWVVFGEVVEMRGKVYIRDITTVEKNWLVEYAPGYYQVRETKQVI